jgi:hypothetical protein
LSDETGELAELETRLLRKFYVWMVVGGLAIGGVGGTGVLRAGKFTSQDAEIMKYEILYECRSYVNSYYRPPIPTRIRIQALEEHHSKNHPDYHPPTKEWQ